jgi:hypothetical protein
MTRKKQYIPESALEAEDLVEGNKPTFPPKAIMEIKFEVEVKVTLKVVKPEAQKNPRKKRELDQESIPYYTCFAVTYTKQTSE